MFEWIRFNNNINEKPSFPTSKEDVYRNIAERRQREAIKLWMTPDEFEEMIQKRKDRITDTTIEVDFVKISRYGYSNGIDMGHLTIKNSYWFEAVAFITKKWQHDPVFGWDFDKFTYAEKNKVRRIAYAHFKDL